MLEQLQKPEHYLGVIYLTSLPEGRGGTQPLPVARDYCGLAVFENLRNAYSGDDGVDALQYCVRQFAQKTEGARKTRTTTIPLTRCSRK